MNAQPRNVVARRFGASATDLARAHRAVASVAGMTARLASAGREPPVAPADAQAAAATLGRIVAEADAMIGAIRVGDAWGDGPLPTPANLQAARRVVAQAAKHWRRDMELARAWAVMRLLCDAAEATESGQEPA